MSFTLIDTSLWTHALRRSGDRLLRERVQGHLDDDSAVWCEVIRLELWKGHRKQDDPDQLLMLERRLPRLSIDTEVWDHACEIAHAMHREGLTVPTADFIIFACARVHGTELAHNDKHFGLIQQRFPLGI